MITKLFLLFIMLATGIPLYAQTDITELDKDHFLIGTLNERDGYSRILSPTTKDYGLTDIFFIDETKIALLIDSLFREEVEDIKLVKDRAKNSKLYSNILNNRIDHFYHYTSIQDTATLETIIYKGRPKESLCISENQLYSYLTGIFIRFGKIQDSVYMISLPNAEAKAMHCKDLLITSGCTDIHYTQSKDRKIPKNILTFTPSDKLKNFFTLFNSYITVINTKRYNSVAEMMQERARGVKIAVPKEGEQIIWIRGNS